MPDNGSGRPLEDSICRYFFLDQVLSESCVDTAISDWLCMVDALMTEKNNAQEEENKEKYVEKCTPKVFYLTFGVHFI